MMKTRPVELARRIGRIFWYSGEEYQRLAAAVSANSRMTIRFGSGPPYSPVRLTVGSWSKHRDCSISTSGGPRVGSTFVKLLAVWHGKTLSAALDDAG